MFCAFFFVKQKTAYEMRISDWVRRVLFRSKIAIAVVIGMVVSFLLYEPIFDILVELYKQVANESNTFTGDERLVQFDPLEGFTIGRASRRERVCQYV